MKWTEYKTGCEGITIGVGVSLIIAVLAAAFNDSKWSGPAMLSAALFVSIVFAVASNDVTG